MISADTESKQRVPLILLTGLLIVVTIGLGFFIFGFLGGGDTSASQPDGGDSLIDDGQDDGQTDGGGEPSGEEDTPSDIDQQVALAETALEIIVRGQTAEGWSIESPDDFGFYPVGPAGPSEFTATSSKGFNDSPDGAGLAAIHILQRLSPVNPDWETVAANQTLGEGPSAVSLLVEQMSSDPAGLEALIDVAARKTAYVGWNIVRFDPRSAVLDLAGVAVVQDPEGGRAVQRFRTQVVLEWSEGDWKLVLLDGQGADFPTPRSVTEFGDLDLDISEAFAI